MTGDYDYPGFYRWGFTLNPVSPIQINHPPCPHCDYTPIPLAMTACNCNDAVAERVRKAVEWLEMLGYKVEPPAAKE